MLEIVVVFVLLLPLYLLVFKLREMRHKQDESAARLTSQMHAVYDALNQQRKVLDQVLRSRAELPRDAGASTPMADERHQPVESVVDPLEIVRREAAASIAVPAVDPSAIAVEPTVSMPAGIIPPGPRSRQPFPVPQFSRASASLSDLADRARTPSLPPRPPRVPNRFEAAAKDVLHRIWNWIIVGEEHVPKGVSVEFAIASQWLLRIGIMLLVVGIGFFLKYSIDHGMLNKTARVALSVAAGLGMLIAGTRILGGKFHVMGQGLLGGGIATLYFSAFAAANLFHLIEMPVAFAAMIGVTALSGFIAVRFHSKLTAVLGVVGGYGTPVMLSTGVVNFPGLYGYMLVLGVGVLGICAWKRWPLLNYLSFAGNFILVFGSLRKGYEADLHFWQVMPFLIAFFVLFSTMVFVFNLFNRTKSNLLDALVLYLNAAIFFCLSYWLIEKHYGEKWVAAVTLGLTAFYMAHVWYCLVRKVLDRELMLSFTALSAFFLAITVPLLLSHEWITVSWAVQALVILWVAGKLNSEFLRHVSYCLYLIVLGRFMFLDLPSQFRTQSLADLPMMDYIWQLVERLVMFGVPIASLALGYRMLVKPGEAVSLAMDKATDIGGWIENRAAAKAAVFVMFGMLFLYMHLELNRTIGALFPPLRLPVLTLLWLSVCVLLVSEYTRSANQVVLGFLAVFVTGMLVKMFFFDLQSWSATRTFMYDGSYTFFDAGFRLLDFGAIIAFFAFATRLLMRQASGHPAIAKDAGTLMAFAGVGMLFLYSTLEVNSFLQHYVEKLRSGGVSILWTLFALAFLVRGISKDIKPLRYAGLALFAVVTWKVFFSDLAKLDQLYRIVAFIVLGVLVLCGSFLYLRSRQTFATKVDGGDDTYGTDPTDRTDSKKPGGPA